MDIHKPHAAKTWREFFIEIGTVVAGILIALALEQGLEAPHEHKIKNEAREAVREEAGQNLNWMNYRERREPCVRQRLAEVGNLLDRAGRQEPFAVARHVHMPAISKITNHVWDANAQSGRASLFGVKEQSDCGNFYYTTDDFSSAQGKETTAWARLSALKGRARLYASQHRCFPGHPCRGKVL